VGYIHGSSLPTNKFSILFGERITSTGVLIAQIEAPFISSEKEIFLINCFFFWNLQQYNFLAGDKNNRIWTQSGYSSCWAWLWHTHQKWNNKDSIGNSATRQV